MTGTNLSAIASKAIAGLPQAYTMPSQASTVASNASTIAPGANTGIPNVSAGASNASAGDSQVGAVSFQFCTVGSGAGAFDSIAKKRVASTKQRGGRTRAEMQLAVIPCTNDNSCRSVLGGSCRHGHRRPLAEFGEDLSETSSPASRRSQGERGQGQQ